MDPALEEEIQESLLVEDEQPTITEITTEIGIVGAAHAQEVFVESQQLKPSFDGTRQYPSLYDSYGTTFIAIILAVMIVSAIIGIVTYIYKRAKSDHAALTQFVTTMFALIAGVYLADKLVAGPSTDLLDTQESLKVLEFIQQTCLMVFAYYFGTKAQPPKEGPPNHEE